MRNGEENEAISSGGMKKLNLSEEGTGVRDFDQIGQNQEEFN
jgi:hypothetical protein